MKKIFPLLIIAVVLLVGYYVSKQSSINIEDCFKLPNSYKKLECLKPFILQISMETSPKEAVDLVNNYQDQGMIDECHLLAHYVGEDLIKRTDYNIPTAFDQCSEKCIQGCYHGVMQKYLSQRVDKSDLVKQLPTLCSEVWNKETSYRQCLHGIGHGLLAHNYLPLKDSIDACNSLFTEYERSTCLGGIFMENMFPLLDLDRNKLLNEIQTVCDPVEGYSDKYLLDMCYYSVGEELMFYTGHNLEDAQNMCEVLKPDYIQTCKDAAKLELDRMSFPKDENKVPIISE